MADPVPIEPSAEVRFGVLGPLQVVDGSGAVWAVPSPKHRIVLAALLLAGGTVSGASLAEALWDGSPPPNAPAVLRTYVMRLRRELGPAGARIARRAPGWAIELHGPEEFDISEADGLWRAARAEAEAGEWRQASLLLTRALSLWRGEPLIDVPSAVLGRREADRLAEVRLQLTEARIDADLRLGRHSELVAELRQLAAEHPLREHIRAQLMLACYRSGQQGAALEVYRDTYARLAEELGVEPGDELRQMHQRVLTADPVLTPPARATISMPGSDQGGQARRGAVVPRQLPGAVRNFTGREAELSWLSGLAGPGGAEDCAAVVVISGMAGVGKTALAVHWARRAASLFADGQLYVNLLGFAPSAQHIDPATVIRGFLEALGVPAKGIPASPQAQAGLYRSLLDGRRMLVVLDNARDAAQVRPLLPGSPGCLVLVTSRADLTGLSATEGAHPLTLEVLADAEACELIAGRLGASRVAAEPQAVTGLVESCAGLPLALAITAARAANRPGHRLAALAAQLRDAGRLDALQDGDAASSVRAVFSWSYGQLSSDAARLFQLLSLHLGPDITTPAAASLAGNPVGQASGLVRELTRAHLLTEPVPGRYALHDLLRAYAAEQAEQTESKDDRREAVGRVLDHYLHTARSAALLLNPARDPISVRPAHPAAGPEHLADQRQALAWLHAEHQVLLTATRLADSSGFDVHAWQIPWALAEFLDRRGCFRDLATTQGTALAAAARLSDTAAQAECLRLLAFTSAHLGDHDQAIARYMASLRLFQQLGDRLGQARVQQLLGLLAESQGRYADALSHAEQALRLNQAMGNRAGEAVMLNNLGWTRTLLGDYQQARLICQEALSLCGELGLRLIEGHVWDSLGQAEHHLGHFPEAGACYDQALRIFREFGDRYFEPAILTHLGDTRQASGDLHEARQAWQQALEILDEIDHPDARQVRGRLADARFSVA